MRRLAVVTSTLALAATMSLTPSAAQAATSQFGNGCSATNYSENVTYVVSSSAPSNPLPASAPMTGIATKATFLLPAEAGAGPYVMKVKTVRPTGVPNEFTVISESQPLSTSAGTHVRDIRMPVKQGDRLGLGGPGALICGTPNAADVLAVFAGDVLPGTTATAAGTDDLASIPVVVTVEPDADKDGFGDVTQDGCPQVASVQVPCPKVKLDSFAVAQDGSILVLVGSSTATKVKVTGTAKLNGKTVKLGGKSKRVKPGKLGRFTVALPAALKAALAKLPASRSIKVTLTASATDAAGRKSKDTSTVSLRGTR